MLHRDGLTVRLRVVHPVQPLLVQAVGKRVVDVRLGHAPQQQGDGADAPRAVVARRVPGQPDEAVLGGDVGGAAGEPSQRGVGADVDDEPARRLLSLRHLRHGVPRHEERARQVDGQHGVPGRLAAEAGGLEAVHDAGVVDHHV